MVRHIQTLKPVYYVQYAEIAKYTYALLTDDIESLYMIIFHGWQAGI